jgi:L-2-hydroxyglutarate oxidase LhgO
VLRDAPTYDVVVIGGGLCGLATAKTLLATCPRLRLAVVEKEEAVAQHQSGRNSGVIHAGLYYTPGSTKARLCQAGREALLRYADERAIPYRLAGKLVVATHERELARLEELRRRGVANGIAGIRKLGAGEWRELEPHVVGLRALHVPETGSIDFADVARHFAADVLGSGGELFLGQKVSNIVSSSSECVVLTDRAEFRSRHVVTCAGLQADRVARMTGDAGDGLCVVPFRGDYFTLQGGASDLIRGHVYPVPDPAFPFLGVHFSRRIDNEVWAGPNAVPAFAREGYRRLSLNPGDLWAAASFPGTWRLARRYYRTGLLEIYRDVVKAASVRVMRRYVPAIRHSDVHLGPSGVRAQVIEPDGSLVDDFRIQTSMRALHLVNAPSPGATASLAIGAVLAGQAVEAFGLSAQA